MTMVAIDGSEHSLKAAQYALEIAKSFSAPLYAVTVAYVSESYHLKQEDVLNQSREMRDSMEDAKTWFEKFNQESKEDNIQLKTKLINSHRLVDYVILEYAEENNIDLIVVETRGRSGLRNYCLEVSLSVVYCNLIHVYQWMILFTFLYNLSKG
jgi:nucleotide-binding universal stress UspA family protein